MPIIMAGMRPPSEDSETTYWTGEGGGFRSCRVNWSVVTGSKEFPSCLEFVVTFLVKGVDSFNKVVDGCGLLESLEDIWGIL